MRYLLDANAVIALLHDTTSPIARRIRRHAPRDFGVSAVVIHELYYGAFKSQRVEKHVARVDALQFPVLEFDRDDARQAGEIRAHLASKGRPLGLYDVLIAGQAKARELTLVTHNTTEFQRVPGLKVEDWKGLTSPPGDAPRSKIIRQASLRVAGGLTAAPAYLYRTITSTLGNPGSRKNEEAAAQRKFVGECPFELGLADVHCATLALTVVVGVVPRAHSGG